MKGLARGYMHAALKLSEDETSTEDQEYGAILKKPIIRITATAIGSATSWAAEYKFRDK